MAQQSETTSQETRNLVSALILRFNEDVINKNNIPITDFVQDHYLPGLQQVVESGIIAGKDKQAIQTNRLAASDYREKIRQRKALALEKEAEELTLKLKAYVMNSLNHLLELMDKPSLKIGREVVSSEDITSAVPSESASWESSYVGPDGLYLINKPPANWKIRLLSISELTGYVFSIEKPSVEKLFSNLDKKREILHLISEKDFSCTPIPGKFKMYGRPIPSVLSIHFPVQLVVMPLDREVPPLFQEHSFFHNAILNLSQAMKVTLLKDLKVGSLPNGRRYLTAEMEQTLENVIVDGKVVERLSLIVNNFAFEGELRDYFLSMKYPLVWNQEEPEEVKTLRSIVNSFRPIKVFDIGEKLASRKQEVNGLFDRWLDNNKAQIFYSEFGIAALRLVGLDLETEDGRQRAMRELEPFKAWSEILHVEDEKLTELWASIAEAKKGDAARFKELVGDICEAVMQVEQSKKG